MWGHMSVDEERIIARVLWSMRKYRRLHMGLRSSEMQKMPYSRFQTNCTSIIPNTQIVMV